MLWSVILGFLFCVGTRCGALQVGLEEIDAAGKLGEIDLEKLRVLCKGDVAE